MDLIKICEFLSASNLRNYRDDDLWIDRLSHRYSVVIFTLFAVLVTSKAYIGDPIDCWAPPEFKASYERYAETLCFVNGTYYISASEMDVPNDPKSRYSNRIRYYQWTPFILLLQAFCMYTPRLIWLSLNTRCGINLHNLVDASKKYETVDSCSNKERVLGYICKNLLRSINYKDYNVTAANEYRRLELAKMLSSISGEAGEKGGGGAKKGALGGKPVKFPPSDKYDLSSLEEEDEYGEDEAEDETEEDNYNQISHSISDDVFLSEQQDPSRPARKKKEVNFKEEKQPRSAQKLARTLKMLDNARAFAVVDEDMNEVSPSQLGLIRAAIRKRYLRKMGKDNEQDYEEAAHPSLINVLKSKITHVSKKHFFNFISSGYESSFKSANDHNQNQNDDEYDEAGGESKLVTIETPDATKSSRCNPFANSNHNYLSALYLFVRLLYILSSVSQVVILNRLIGNDFYMIGIKLIDSFLNETEWPQLAIFPRSTLCEIYIREIGAIHPYLIQCVLRINLFNEVIFVLVWYWLLFLLVVGAVDFLIRLVALLLVCPNCQRKLFALKYLELIHLNESYSKAPRKDAERSNEDVVAAGLGADKPGSRQSGVYYSAAPRPNPNAVISNTPIIVSKRRIFFNVDHESNRMKTNFPDVAGIYDPYKDPTYQSLVATNTFGLDGDDDPSNPYAQGYMLNENATFLLRKAFNLKAAEGEDEDVIVYSSMGGPSGGRFDKSPLAPGDDRHRVNFNLKKERHGSRGGGHPSEPGGGGGGGGDEGPRFVEELMIPISQDEECEIFDKFCQIYFTNDSIFALRVIQINASSLIVSEIIEFLWSHFKRLNLIITNEKNNSLAKRFYLIRKKPPSAKPHEKKSSRKSSGRQASSRIDTTRLTPPKFKKTPRQRSPERTAPTPDYPEKRGILSRRGEPSRTTPEASAPPLRQESNYYENQFADSAAESPTNAADAPSYPAQQVGQGESVVGGQRSITRRKLSSKDLSV